MLYKKAWLETILRLPIDAVDSTVQLSAPVAAMVLAAAGLTGTGLGYAMSKATEKRPQDFDVEQRAYMNARLGADIRNVAAKIRQEREAIGKQPAKSIRI